MSNYIQDSSNVRHETTRVIRPRPGGRALLGAVTSSRRPLLDILIGSILLTACVAGDDAEDISTSTSVEAIALDPCASVTDRLAEIAGNAAASLAANGTPGWSVVVSRRVAGESEPCVATSSGGFARSNADGYRAFSPDVSFAIASQSKIVTAVAATDILAKHGIPRTSAIGSHLPSDWPLGPGVANITFAELLTHTSGLTPGSLANGGGADLEADIRQWLADGVTAPSKPYSYSNSGMALVQLLVARIQYGPNVYAVSNRLEDAGLKLSLYVDAILLDPHGIPVAGTPSPSCTFDTAGALAYPISSPLTVSGGQPSTTTAYVTCGTGRWNFTARNFARFLDRLWNGDLLGKTLTDELVAHGYGFEKTSQNYLVKGGLLVVGGDYRFKSGTYIFPDGTVAVAFINSNSLITTSVTDAYYGTSEIAPAFTELELQNGWTNAPFSTRNAAVAFGSDIVHFKGAIAHGTTPVAFTLPSAFRPATNVYVPVDLCGAAKGRLFIQPSGVVSIQAEGAFSDAQCFTSLEGVSFAPSASTFKPLTLQNGWTHAPYGTSDAAARNLDGIVHLKGAIAGGTTAVAFTLPSGSRPATDVYVPVDLCNAKKGRLYIQPTGVVTVVAEVLFSSAQCFTSLDGASFAQDPSTFTTLTLQNGWTHAPAGTGEAAVEHRGGIVHFKGAIAGGTTAVAFTLPSGLRPATNVYVPVDLCNATKGRMFIQPSGTVTVHDQGGAISNAQCATSLEGASFALSDFTPLTLQNGWTHQPYGTADAAFALIGGAVHLRGAIAGGTSAVAFTLPIGFRPVTGLFVPVDLYNAAKGRLFIQPSGAVSVVAEGGTFSNAQSFTSLEGVSFALTADSFTALTLQNGWRGAAYARPAAVTNDAGIIRLEGAIESGTSGVAFTLPSGFRPATNVYVPVDLCSATKGRLYIQPSGVVTIHAEGSFSNAQCFTSLEGVSFALSTSSFTALTLQNGWTSAPFGTRAAAVTNDAGIIRFGGAIAGGTTSTIFTLPSGLRPATEVYVPVDLCNAANGRLHIQPSGVVTVLAEGLFSSAQCFTSLEGASFAL